MTPYREKPVTDAQIDLGLYIEGLLTVDGESKEAEQADRAIDLVETEFEKTPLQPASLEPDANHSETTRNNLDCLYFTVDDTSFMLPATKIASLEKLNRSLTRLPLLPEAIKGMFKFRNRSIPVIDLLTLMNTNNQVSSDCIDNDREDMIKYAIVIDGTNYAIACNEIGAIENIPSGNIRWNTSSSTNCFYSGIIATRLCPLLDIDRITELAKSLSLLISADA